MCPRLNLVRLQLPLARLLLVESGRNNFRRLLIESGRDNFRRLLMEQGAVVAVCFLQLPQRLPPPSSQCENRLDISIQINMCVQTQSCGGGNGPLG